MSLHDHVTVCGCVSCVLEVRVHIGLEIEYKLFNYSIMKCVYFVLSTGSIIPYL